MKTVEALFDSKIHFVGGGVLDIAIGDLFPVASEYTDSKGDLVYVLHKSNTAPFGMLASKFSLIGNDVESKVRAKFLCIEKAESTQSKDGHRYTRLKFTPVTTGSEENKTFWAYTPSGVLEMNIMNKDASAKFDVGKEYYLDFTLAE